MFYNLINRSTAAFGGAPFRSNLCTALGSAGADAGAGAADYRDWETTPT